jgi:hypothetical protein
MPRVEFEPTSLVFERAKAVRALDRAATVIGGLTLSTCKLQEKILQYNFILTYLRR